MKIAFCLGSRANWGSSKTVVRECIRRGLQAEVILFGSALSERYTGSGWDLVDNVKYVTQHDPNALKELPSHIEPTTPLGASKAAAMALGSFDFAGYDLVYVVGDRYEVLAPAYAATVQGVRIAHQMGGEVSGNIDEHIRHAITKLAHVHFVANESARDRVVALGEPPDHVHVTGCPRMDLIREAEPGIPEDRVLVMLHPEENSGALLKQTRGAIVGLKDRPGVLHWFWPNADPGSSDLVRGVRYLHDELKGLGIAIQIHRGLPPEQFYSLLKGARLFIGNSSVAVRDCAFAGVEAVLVGSRQAGRQRSTENPFGYGTGYAGARIAEILQTVELPPVQKRMK